MRRNLRNCLFRYRNIRWATCGLVALGVLLIFVALMVAVKYFGAGSDGLKVICVSDYPVGDWIWSCGGLASGLGLIAGGI